MDQDGNLETNDNTTVVSVSLASSAGLPDGTTSVTVKGGIATFTNLSETTAGTFALQFAGDGFSAGPSTNIVVSPAAPFGLAIHTQPSTTATAGQAFATQPVITEEDEYGNVETGDNSTVITASLATGVGPIVGTRSLTLVNGVATFAGLSDDRAETLALEFTGGGLTSAPTNAIVVSPATATKLVILTQPSPTATAGQAFATQPVVAEEDPFGNVETGDSSTVVSVSLAGGSGPLQGATSIAVANGVATFTNLADDKAETIALGFSDGGLTPATSTSIVVNPAAAYKLVVTQQPSTTATAGQSFATQPIVAEEDQYGNVITGDSTSTVTAARGSLGTASLQGTNLTVTLHDGVAAFGGLSYDKAETMNLGFTTDAGGVLPASSNDVVVSPAAASQLVIVQQPSSTATAGQAFATQPVVYEEDQFGNLLTGDNSTVVTAMLNTGAGPLQGTTAVTVSGGVARFTNLGDSLAETASLVFTAGTLSSPPTNAIVVSPAQAARLVIHTQPSSSATAGQPFAVQPVVYLVDQNGNLETNDNTTVVSVALANAAGLPDGTTSVTVKGGVATFTDLFETNAGTFDLEFTGGGFSAGPSTNIVVSPAAPFRLAIQTQPSTTATAGQAFASQPVIDELDLYGNLESGDNSTAITASVTFGNGPLLGTTTVTVVGGVATFTGLADPTVGTISLGFAGGGLSVGPSNLIAINPGAATQLVIQTQPYAAVTAGNPLSDPIVVAEEDQYGNVVTTDSSTVVSVSLASGGGALTGPTTATVVNGIASFNNLYHNTAGTIALQFAAGSLPAVTSISSVVSPAPPSALIIKKPPSGVIAGVAFATEVDAQDPYGNLATSFAGPVTLALASGSGTLGGTVTVTAAAGVADFNDLVSTTSGTISLAPPPEDCRPPRRRTRSSSPPPRPASSSSRPSPRRRPPPDWPSPPSR